jgi:hypothetical protein
MQAVHDEPMEIASPEITGYAMYLIMTVEFSGTLKGLMLEINICQTFPMLMITVFSL